MMNPDSTCTLTGSDGATTAAELRTALVAFFYRRCNNPAEAEDLAQDVLVRSLGNRHWASTEHLHAYVFHVAENCWRDRGRRKVVRSLASDVLSQPFPSDGLSPERIVLSQDQLVRAVAILETLAERTRDIFMLCRFEGMRKADVAATLGISMSSVDKHLSKALAALVKCL